MSAAAASGLRASVRELIVAELAARRRELAELDAVLDPLVAALDGLAARGKLLRPLFCYWGWRAAGGASDPSQVLPVAAALELLHVSALVHDDLMDASDLRRGLPTAHRRLEEVHRGGGWHGPAEQFGLGAAVLLGDLCLSWSDDVLRTALVDPASLARAAARFALMRTEVIAGQYLDLVAQASSHGSMEVARKVVDVKSARYTVQRPLEIGCLLAGGDDGLVRGLGAYGGPLGAAFQLRDDLLGVFGDPVVTGKPAGDDLREGKQTVLVAHAYATSDAAGRATLDRHLGTDDPAGVLAIRDVLVTCGAVERVEADIARLVDDALAALDAAPVDGEARLALRALASEVTEREA